MCAGRNEGRNLAAAFALSDLVLLSDHPLGVDLVTNSMDLQQGGVTCVSFWVGGDGSDWIQTPRALSCRCITLGVGCTEGALVLRCLEGLGLAALLMALLMALPLATPCLWLGLGLGWGLGLRLGLG